MTKGRQTAAAQQRVVGVGASAGGLDALKQLIAAIPDDTGLAFVVLQHLPPSQTGQLASLLASCSRLPVLDAATGHRIKPNTILVVPPRTAACLYRGSLVLRTAKGGARPRMPIDSLFGSLASVLGARAVGVVLSGTAHDGTEGLRAIRDAGGLTFAQDPATAQFDEMPRSAIAAGVVEAVLAPALLGEKLGEISRLAARPAAAPRAAAPPDIDRVLAQLREASGIDFTSYKRTTIERRLARRLARHHLGSLGDYSKYLEAHPDEASAVYEDLLIHVTEFFRDRPALDRLAARVLPEILGKRPVDAPVRVWVPGCSTGEEVYSLAILLLEAAGDGGRQIQLFGSDLSERAIDTARQGSYPEAILARVGPKRIARFFVRDDAGYRIKQDVRERCVFVRHDLVSDPPFSRLDLVSCRNVLIYLGAPLQHRAISIFHYALEQPGYLMLGRAETITGFDALFEPVDADARIYARKPAARTTLAFPLGNGLGQQPRHPPAGTLRSPIEIQRDVDHILLARYAPACVLVDDNLEILQFRGRTGLYLEQPPGQPQVNLLKLTRDGLASELPLAIQAARDSGHPVRRENVVVRDDGRDHQFHLEVVPLTRVAGGKRYLLVVFEPITSRASPPRRAVSSPPRDRGQYVRASQELEAMKQYFQSLVAQHVTATEELGLTNEELQSANEELQSTNEELQTAKEELQSTNEELETLNEELHSRNALLREANDDLINVLASVEIAIIIVDADRRIRRFTPKARALIKLIASDIGRPIADLQPSVAVPGLDEAIAEVIETLAIHEWEVHHSDGTWYRMQIRPYRTADRKISGAVIAFVDITALRAAHDYAAAIVETVPTPLVVLDGQLRIESANRAFYAAFDTAPGVANGRALLELGTWRDPTLQRRLAAVLTTGAGFEDHEVVYRGTGGERVLRLGSQLLPPAAAGALILIGIADVTDRRRLEQAREAATNERNTFLDAISHELRAPLSAILLWAEALRGFDHDDPRRFQAIETIAESARSEAQLIDDLLELALSRSTGLSMKLEPVDPSPIVCAVIEAARPEADGKQIAIETALATVPKITADPRRLRQITSSLLGNAIKFTPAGGKVWVVLTLHDGAMELQIRDTGLGMSPAFLSRAFEPFSRADPSSTRAHRGLGIGLALVRHLVESQGGTIDIASPGDGQGTRFTVRIPSPA